MRVNCYFCGHPQEVPEMDDLFTRRIAKAAKTSSKEVRNAKWKYVCDECTRSDEYKEWMMTDEAAEHIALTEDAKIIE